jgi:molecular chaperone HtpG
MSEETMKFDAEVGKILQLMIHSLYTNKDIFLRELISNSSDACDKLRYLALTNPNLTGDDSNFKITISSDKAAKTITISDNGIGMNKSDLIENLGTIARSGTQQFMQQLTGDSKKDLELIGQFGVGFYSAFMVADKITVISCKAGEEQNWFWQSSGDGTFTIAEHSSNELKRGTKITLHLRDSEEDFLDRFRIGFIVSTYSDHVAFPIEFIKEDGTVEVLNKASALWTRSKSDITDEQYKEFYKHSAHAFDDPWMILHNKNEGMVEYTNLLYIPSTKPFDLFHPDRKTRVKLYVKRVFITEEGIDLVPAYMRFLRGVIDSEDLPLNISRETLQYNNVVDKIRKSVVKRVLSELKKKLENDRDSYLTFWNNFGAVLKEGLCEASENREQLLEACLFRSALTDQLITIDQYVANMKADQKEIYYYLTGGTKITNSPQLEGFIKRGIDVLLLDDTVDDFWVNVEHQYKEKEIKSITRTGIDLPEEEKAAAEQAEKEAGNVLDYFKDILKDRVSDVKVSHKLVDSPVCLSVSENAMDIRMERFLLEQKQIKTGALKILEINLHNPVIKKIKQEVESNLANDDTAELVNLLFDQTCIVEGEVIQDAGAFAKRMNKVLERLVR